MIVKVRNSKTQSNNTVLLLLPHFLLIFFFVFIVLSPLLSSEPLSPLWLCQLIKFMNGMRNFPLSLIPFNAFDEWNKLPFLCDLFLSEPWPTWMLLMSEIKSFLFGLIHTPTTHALLPLHFFIIFFLFVLID
jgi:hypothetical protein